MVRHWAGISITACIFVFSQVWGIEKKQGITSTPDKVTDFESAAKIGYGEDGETPIFFQAKLPSSTPNSLAKASASVTRQGQDSTQCRQFLGLLARNLKGFHSDGDFRIETKERESNRSHFHV